jgi:choline dehydrogenase
LGDPATAWHYPTRPFGPSQQVEYWVRGKTLGGSSSVNGMVYNRGNRADYDALERLGNPGWGWDDMLPVFKAIEDNELGASDVRGAGGPLHVSTADGGDPLLEDVIAAGTQHGWRRMRDLNETDEERIGYAMTTIRDGRRVSAADAFLHPVTDRPNLTVGARMREHRAFTLQVRLAEDLGYNRLLGTEAAEREYRTSRRGPLATPPCDIVAFVKMRPELDRPDAQLQIAAYSILPLEPGAPL